MLISSIRQRIQSRAHGVFCVFAVVWLVVAVQPCAMALEAAPDVVYVHCPSAGHGTAALDTAADASPATVAEPICGSSLADCYALDDAGLDGRGGQPKLKDAPGDSPLALAPPSAVIAASARALLRPAGHDGPPRAPAQALNIVNCVYLK